MCDTHDKLNDHLFFTHRGNDDHKFDLDKVMEGTDKDHMQYAAILMAHQLPT